MQVKNILGVMALSGALLYTHETKSDFNLPTTYRLIPELDQVSDQPLENRLTIDEQAEELNKSHNYRINGEDLVFITRVTYMEAGNDPKAKTSQDLKKGWEAVAQVILNRYLFDKNNQTKLFSKNNDLRAVAEAPWQFHPVKFFPKIFDPTNFYDKDDNLTLSYEKISKNKIKLVYDTVVETLKQEKEDPTNDALYFHADYVRNGRNDNTRAFYLHKRPCRIKFTTQINTHRFFRTTCPTKPYATSEQ